MADWKIEAISAHYEFSYKDIFLINIHTEDGEKFIEIEDTNFDIEHIDQMIEALHLIKKFINEDTHPLEGISSSMG